MTTPATKTPAPPVLACRCDGCRGLQARYARDPKLLAFYGRILLQRGWAGRMDDVERAYALAHAPWYQAAVEKARRMREEHPNPVTQRGVRRGPDLPHPPALETRSGDGPEAAGLLKTPEPARVWRVGWSPLPLDGWTQAGPRIPAAPLRTGLAGASLQPQMPNMRPHGPPPTCRPPGAVSPRRQGSERALRRSDGDGDGARIRD